jgi:hypothetical protein
MKKFLLVVLVAFSSMMNSQTATHVAPVRATIEKTVEKKAVAKAKQVANLAAYACIKCFKNPDKPQTFGIFL